jgi:hypothetical protein
MSVRKIKPDWENGGGYLMGSQTDKENMRNGNSVEEASFNQNVAEAQRDKTMFRAHKTALSADPFNPARLSNATPQTLTDC